MDDMDDLRRPHRDDNIHHPVPRNLDRHLLFVLRPMRPQLLHDTDAVPKPALHLHRHHDRHILHDHDAPPGPDHHQQRPRHRRHGHHHPRPAEYRLPDRRQWQRRPGLQQRLEPLVRLHASGRHCQYHDLLINWVHCGRRRYIP